MAPFGNLFKSVAEFIKGSTPPYVLGQAQKSGLHPEYDDKFLIDNDDNWPYICSRIVASCIAQQPIRLFATRSTGQQRARTRSGGAGRVLKRSSEDYAYLKNHPYIRKQANFNGAEEVEEIYDHPLLDLLNAVNDSQNGFEAMYLTSVYMDLTGDAYWYLENDTMGIPEKMFVLLSQYTKIVPGTEELIRGYLYGHDSSNIQAFPPEEVIHFKWPNPENPYYGKGKLEPIIRAALRDRKMDNLESARLENGGAPRSMIGYKGKMNEADRRSLQGEFDRMVRRGDKAGGIFVTSHDPQVYSLGQSLQDMAFPTGRAYNRDQCANSFGVPLSMLESGDFGRANFDASLYAFAKNTLLPKMTLIDQKLNEQLVPMYDGADRLIVCFDNPVPDDVDTNMKIEDQRLKTGVITPNEVRAREGLDPLPNGDVPLTELRSMTGPQQAQKAYDIKAKEPKPSDEPSREFPGAITGGENDPLNARERGLANEAGKHIKEYNKEATRVLKGATTVPMMVSLAEGGLVGGTLLNELVINLADASLPWMADGFIKGGQMGQEKLGLNVSMWIDQPDAVAEMRERALKFSNEVYQARDKDIQSSLTQAIEKGWSVDETTKAISDKVGEKSVKWQSERIARTEMAKSEHKGMIKLWKDTGIVKAKQWDAANDACPFCLDMHGKIVGLDEAFWTAEGPNQFVEFRGRTIEMKHEFDDVISPPLHPNCRCTLQPVLFDE